MPDWRRRLDDDFARAGHHPDDAVLDELAQHAQDAWDAARTAGHDERDADAQVAALIAGWIGEGAQLTRRRGQPAAVEPPPVHAHPPRLRGLWQDVRYAGRLVRRRPGAPLLAAFTMAVGIAATTTLFSVTWGVLLKPLPWPQPESLVRLEESREGAVRSFTWILTNGPYLAWADEPETIDTLAAYTTRTATLTAGAGGPERVQIAAATASLFAVLRAVPAHGALFTAHDEPADNTIVLAHDFWRRRFGGADAIGQSLQLDGRPYVVAGVLRPDFAFPDRETVGWIPYHVRPTATPNGGSWIQMFSAVARLKPGATVAQASAEATSRARGVPGGGAAALAVFGTEGPPSIRAEPILEAVTGGVRNGLQVLLAAVLLLLAAATANVAALQVARATARRQEMAVRAAIGAGTARLARQLLIENLVIGAIGACLGLVLAAILVRMLVAWLPADFPRVSDIALDRPSLLFAVAASLLASLAFGAWPAWQASRVDLRTGLVDGAAPGSAISRRSSSRLRTAMLIGQVAIACLLLVGSSLLLKSFVAMKTIDRGYEPAGVLTARVATPSGLFTPERRAALVAALLERLRARPDVMHAGTTNVLPLLGGESMMALNLDTAPGAPARTISAGFRMVSPGYIEAMGLRVAAGRTLTDADTSDSMPVLVVNRTFERTYLPAGAVGHVLPVEIYDGIRGWTIVGVVEDVAMRGTVRQPAAPEMFVSYRQAPGGLASQPIVAVRTYGDPARVVGPLRTILALEAPMATLESVMTMEERVAGSLTEPRLYAVLLGAFAMAALAIAAVGLFGLLSVSVVQRTRELGVRAALGARPGDLVRLVVREGLLVTAIGTAVGLGAAVAGISVLSAFLYGVEPYDPATFIVAPAILFAAALVASVVPARRVTRLDPLRAIR